MYSLIVMATLAQCPPGMVCPPRQNYIDAGGVYNMYPQVIVPQHVVNVQPYDPTPQPSRPRPNSDPTPNGNDWTAGYKEWKDKEGRRYLVAHVDSAHGKGWVFFKPDAWKAAASPTPQPEVQEQAINYGIDVSQLQSQPMGSFMSNDPSFDPNQNTTFGALTPGQPELGIALGWFVCGLGLSGFVAFLFNYHRGARRCT